MPACYALLLWVARAAIKLEEKTPLASGLEFLYADYHWKFYWWRHTAAAASGETHL